MSAIGWLIVIQVFLGCLVVGIYSINVIRFAWDYLKETKDGE